MPNKVWRRISELRSSANRTNGAAAAGMLHLADLLTHHRLGFPNVREPSSC